MFWFTADQHFGHGNIIKHSNRPFYSVDEMDEAIINNYNQLVRKGDTVYHLGDFSLFKKRDTVIKKYLSRIKGKNVFISGNHDYWLLDRNPYMEFKLQGFFIVCCHYALRVWNRSHYGSINLHGHSHGNLAPFRNQYDVGVDNNNYKPISLDQIKERLGI